jgi:hypothetical protein
MGGATKTATRRAARPGDPGTPTPPFGREPGPLPASRPPSIHIADDPNAAWTRITPTHCSRPTPTAPWLATASEGVTRYTPTDDAITASAEAAVDAGFLLQPEGAYPPLGLP